MLDAVDPDFGPMSSWLLFEHTSVAEWAMPPASSAPVHAETIPLTKKMNHVAILKPGQSASEQDLMVFLAMAMIEEIDNVRAKTFNSAGQLGLPTLGEEIAARKAGYGPTEVPASPDNIMRAIRISCAKLG
jgi:hypothetical protein